jgi:methylamine dehydrogenase accessory protein MauD
LDLALLAARLLVAAVFVVAGVAKLIDRGGSRQAVMDFGLPAGLAAPIGLLLPVAEITVAVALILTATAWWGALGALLLLLAFMGGIAVNLAQGKTPDCHCFGQLHSEPIGWSTVVRNVVLSLIALFVLIAGYGHPGPDAVAWLGGLTWPERLAVGLGVLALLAAGAQWWLLLHPPVWLADRLPLLGGAHMVETPDTDASSAANEQPGLPVGSRAPRFRLPGLFGETMTLDALRAGGRAVALIFVSPDCGPCAALMPDIARWQLEYPSVLRFVLISSGTVEENRHKVEEHGLTELLLQKSFEVGSVYDVSGTPGAVIVHPSGVIGSPVAGGADQIRALLDQYVELLASQHGIELDDEGELARAMREAASPLEIGAPAPELQFEDLSGNSVRLADFRGRDTAVLFWSTTCGFCRSLEPVLQAWEDDQPEGAPNLLVVLDAPLEDRQSVPLRSPVLIDRDAAASGSLHGSGTPTAVLIDANGAIASQPAVGADAIRPLLRLDPVAPAPPPIQLRGRAPARPEIDLPTPAQDLPIGSPAPDVVFKDLRGGALRLSDLRGKDTLLLFWNGGDDLCRSIEPQVLAWETRRPASSELVVVVPGASGGNQIVSFGSRVVIDRDGSAARALGMTGTPTGLVIDAQGSVASDPADGVGPVLALLQRLSRETAEAPA